jgi:hypothetical protein
MFTRDRQFRSFVTQLCSINVRESKKKKARLCQEVMEIIAIMQESIAIPVTAGPENQEYGCRDLSH